MTVLYFDYAASTPIDMRVAEHMIACLQDKTLYANPSSLHALGRNAKAAIETARAQVAALIHAEADEIIWTSGATEANNLAIKGAAHLYSRKGKHLITMCSEHKAVLEPCQHLEKEGYQVTYLRPTANGLVNFEELAQAIRDDTILVSMMQVNNETGVVQDIKRIAQLTRARNVLFHVDAAQSPGKIKMDVKEVPVDLLSLSAHKIYGPKGVGALYLRKKPRVRLSPLFHGGGHEQGLRSGTLATHQIVGMGAAFALAQQLMDEEIARIAELRAYLLAKLKSAHGLQIALNANDTVVPHILNVRFEGRIADAMLAKSPSVAVTTASACQGHVADGSYVLRAMGYNQAQIQSAMRISLGRFTTKAEIDELIEVLDRA